MEISLQSRLELWNKRESIGFSYGVSLDKFDVVLVMQMAFHGDLGHSPLLFLFLASLSLKSSHLMHNFKHCAGLIKNLGNLNSSGSIKGWQIVISSL